MKSTIFFKLLLTLLIMAFLPTVALSQTITQTIKGNVFDVQTKETLIGATIFIVDSEPLLGSSADNWQLHHKQGSFRQALHSG